MTFLLAGSDLAVAIINAAEAYAETIDMFVAAKDKAVLLEQVKLLRDFAAPLIEADNTRSPWQPIESAPQDGTAILVCYAPQYDTNGFLPVAVRWGCYHPNAKGKEAFRLANGNKVEILTHWMPLPEPPK